MQDNYKSTTDSDNDNNSINSQSRSRVGLLSTVIAWTVIILCVAGLTISKNLEPEATQSNNGDDTIGLVVMKLQSRILLGQNILQPAMNSVNYQSAKDVLNIGTIPQRLRFVVIGGEMSCPEEALTLLDDLDSIVEERADVDFSEKQTEVRDILRKLYTDYSNQEFDAPSLDNNKRELLKSKLDWFGELALLPAGTAATAERDALLNPLKTLMIMMVVGMILGAGIGFLGLVGLIILICFAFMKRLQNRVGSVLQHGHIYAETFAVWLIFFFGLMTVLEFLPVPQDFGLLAIACFFFLSLLALLWPVLRGISWKQVRHDIGWRKPSKGILEIFVGMGCYAMTLPLLAAGLAMTFLLIYIQTSMAGGGTEELFGPTGGPAHPIIESFSSPDIWPRVQVLIIACIAAPVVEETMFRGVLYRHLRSLTNNTGIATSIILSACISSLIFASIHPQGWVAIPALASLACGMALTREWRGSLLSSMIVHGTSNGIVMCMLMILLGSS